MRRIRVLQEAAEELEEAVAWYELQRESLGGELARAVDVELDVLESPTVPLVAIPGRGGKRVILQRSRAATFAPSLRSISTTKASTCPPWTRCCCCDRLKVRFCSSSRLAAGSDWRQGRSHTSPRG